MQKPCATCPGGVMTLRVSEDPMRWRCDRCQAEELQDPEALGIDPDFTIADEIGEYVGWRAWYVVKTRSTVRVASLMTVAPGASLWPTDRYLDAICPKCLGDDPDKWWHNPKDVPNETCSCGIYVARTREHLVGLRYNSYSDSDKAPRVIGECAISGKVEVHEQGYRAQRARVAKLYVPHNRWRLAKVLSDTYNVPVGLMNLFTGELKDE